jgi:hypothetical protein
MRGAPINLSPPERLLDVSEAFFADPMVIVRELAALP